MSPPEHYHELTRLLSGLLDGQLENDERVRLEQWLQRDPQARLLYMQFVDMEVEFACLAHPIPPAGAGVALAVPPPTEPRPASRRWGRLFAAAVALVVLGLTVLWLRPGKQTGQGAASATLTQLQGTVEIVSPDGQARSGSSGSHLESGDVVQVQDEHSAAQLTLAGNIRLSLSGKSSLVIGDLAANPLVLREGTLEATVGPQSPGEKFVVSSPQVKVQVVGTTFILQVSPGQTSLEVREGRVRLTRLWDGKVVEINAGQQLLVRMGSDLVIQDRAELPLAWHAGFEEGLPRGWGLGERVSQGLPPGSRGGVQAVRAPMPDAEGQRAWLIASQRDPNGLFALHDDAHLHFMYRMRRPGGGRLILVTRNRRGELASEAIHVLPRPAPGKGESPWDVPANQWHSATVPLSHFRSLPARVSDSLPVALVFSTGEQDRGLVIDRIWVTRGGPGRVRIVNRSTPVEK